MPRLPRHPQQLKIGKFLGITFRAIRKAKGMQQQEVAERLSIKPQAVCAWENGTTLPSMAAMFRVSDLFDTPVSELFRIAEKAMKFAEEEAARRRKANERAARLRRNHHEIEESVSA